MAVRYTVFNVDRANLLADKIYVAGTSAARRRGLLGVDQLETGSGTWIAPCEAIHTFGMKIPIDVIFLDRELRVKKLVPALRPKRLSLNLSSKSVLELEAGVIQRTGTRPGDRLRFSPIYER